MKRTVKAWALLTPRGRVMYVLFAKRGPRCARATIIYDDGKPKRKTK